MKTNDSVMREKFNIEWHSLTVDLIDEMKKHGLQAGNLPLSRWFVQWEKQVKDLYSHSLAEARREWVEEMRKGFDKKAHNLTENDEYWGITSENMDDLLTGDNPERKV